MRTPERFARNLEDGLITDEMLSECLYSVNKRAKNFRDKAAEIGRYFRDSWYSYDRYGSYGKACGKRDQYYEMKDKLLSLADPVCIHRELQGYGRRRIYDYEKDYKRLRGGFVWENCYFDYERGREVWFGDIPLKDEPRFRFYLFYELPGHSFHSPIAGEDPAAISDSRGLEIVDVDRIVTSGHDYGDLISVQFVRKVIALIDSGEYTYIRT